MQTLNLFEEKINPLNTFLENLPKKPYCTDELGYLEIRIINQAIKKKYIQPNSPWNLRWFVYDIDRPTASVDWYELDAPAPNIVATNMQNGHSHLFYGLEFPVYKQPEAHQNILRYAASIDVALNKKLNADPGYAGLISKNPLHDFWKVESFEKREYDLEWLADYVDLEPYKDKRSYLPPIGLGRNCTLFDLTRHWAYRQIRRTNYYLNEEFFIYECTQYATGKNSDFPIPLPYTEVKSTGKSVGKWTWKNMSPEGFNKWCSRRGKKSGIVRATKRDIRAEEIRYHKLANPHLSNLELASIFQVSLRTVKSLKLSNLKLADSSCSNSRVQGLSLANAFCQKGE